MFLSVHCAFSFILSPSLLYMIVWRSFGDNFKLKFICLRLGSPSLRAELTIIIYVLDVMNSKNFLLHIIVSVPDFVILFRTQMILFVWMCWQIYRMFLKIEYKLCSFGIYCVVSLIHWVYIFVGHIYKFQTEWNLATIKRPLS